MGNKKGIVLPFITAIVAVVFMITIFLSNMIQHDARLVKKAMDREKARFMAEAGVEHALAKIKEDGFHNRANFSNTIDTGRYSVVYRTIGERYIVESTGTVPGASFTVTAEIEDTTPTALFYFAGAGNDIKLRASGGTHSVIIGDLHANNDTLVRSASNSSVSITGDVSATHFVQEGAQHYSPDSADTSVIINGMANDSAEIEEFAPRITFPIYDYSYYKELAIDSGDYYDTDQSFHDVTLSPANGIVYVDGTVDIHGTCAIEGGIIADGFNIHGTLNQVKSGDTNIVVAKNGDIAIHGRFYAEEALVDSMQDIASHENGATFEVNGIMIARRDVNMWNVRTTMIYTHVLIVPPGLENNEGVRVVSWNR